MSEPQPQSHHQSFDASEILYKLRQHRGGGGGLNNTSKLNTSFDKSNGFSEKNTLSSNKNRFIRKDRSEVRIELENQIDFLTNEVTRLKRENKQLQVEKEELEYKCMEIKDKADVTISKLRNQLVASNKKLSEANVSTTKDKYVAKKNLQKTFSKGAGIVNIPGGTSTIPQNPSTSIQSLTFSQFMKRNSQQESEGFNSSLRQYTPQQHDHHQYDQKHYNSSLASSDSIMIHDDIFSPHKTSFNGNGSNNSNIIIPPSDQIKEDEEDQSDHNLYYQHHSHLGASVTAPLHGRRKTIFEDPNKKSIQARSSVYSSAIDDSHNIDRGQLFVNNTEQSEISLENYDEDLPIVDIDLRA
jgi:hypothetical protein